MTFKCWIGKHEWSYDCIIISGIGSRDIRISKDIPDGPCPSCFQRICRKCHRRQVARRFGWRNP